MIKIFSNYRRVYVTRDGQTVEVTCGDEITADEFATMVCEGDVECVHQITGDLIKFIANETAPAVVTDTTPAPVAQRTPAPDAGLVPVPVDTGSKNTKA
jgi:hypothetical protein